MDKRTKEIKIRLTESEHERLLARCDRAHLAEWLRSLGLGEHVLRRRRVPDVDPALLRQVTGIGNNLNQIARKLHGLDAIHEQNTRQTTLLRRSVTIALIWILVCGVLLIGILSGILWFQGTLIASRLDEMNSYSQQLTDLKAKSGAGVEILTDDTRKNKYYVVLPKSAKGVELYTSKNDKQVVTYTAK